MTIKKLRNTIIYITLYTLLPGYLSSQNYASPMDIPLSLSANMGELRNNHFHSGIDIKTQRVENKKMFAIADGYVSRISISPSGYGLAICIDHPETGHTSVYGHVNGFSPEIEKYVKEQQYEQERYKVDLRPSKNQFIVKRGQFIGYSGNTGSSFGPHIHFEIRNTKTQMVLDPLVYYKDRIKDTVAPEIRGLAFYPQEGVGVINNSSLPYRIAIRKNKKNEYLPLKDTITAWGRIGIGVKAYDRMNGATNVYGVKLVKLFLDGKEIFSSDITSYSFDQTRMINSFADFAAWRNSNQWFMKSFIEPGNKLPFYKAVDNGYINIDREKTYSLKYILTDLYGNSLSYNFVIKGKKQPVFDEKKCSLFMHLSLIHI